MLQALPWMLRTMLLLLLVRLLRACLFLAFVLASTAYWIHRIS
jgi:hypothetical protein